MHSSGFSCGRCFFFSGVDAKICPNCGWNGTEAPEQWTQDALEKFARMQLLKERADKFGLIRRLSDAIRRLVADPTIHRETISLTYSQGSARKQPEKWLGETNITELLEEADEAIK